MESSKGQVYVHTLFYSGLSQDTDPELMSPESGNLLDSEQFVVKNKLAGVVQKMAGDKLITGHVNQAIGNHTCIGLRYLNGYVIEFWREGSATAIYMNGQQVATHAHIPGDATHHLDMDVNADIPEIYITDGLVRPVIYNINDLWDSRATTKYKADYNRELYEINTQIQLNPPAFFGLEDMGAGGGLRIGSYSYSMRYVNRAGDTSKWSQQTPSIPVPVGYSEEKIEVIPGHRVYGGDPSLNASKYGIKLRIRVTNTQGFDFVQLRRFAHEDGAPIEFTPSAEVYTIINDSNGDVDIKDNPISTIDFVDCDQRNWILYDEDEVTETSPIKSAKTIRLIDGRIVLGGIIYESRIAADKNIYLAHVNSNPAIPIKKELDQGYHDINNQVYNKSVRLGEMYGYGVKLIDTQGNSQYTIPLRIGTNNYIKFPERREAIPANEKPFSKNPTNTSAVSNTLDDVYEVFDQGTTEKIPSPHLINITRTYVYNPLTPTGRGMGAIAIRPPTEKRIHDQQAAMAIEAETGVFTGHRRTMGGNTGLRHTAGKVPSTAAPRGMGRTVPSGNNGRRYEGAQSIVNTHIGKSVHGINNEPQQYNPNNYQPSIKATGLSIKGVDTSKLPSWVQGFSVVRTKPAGRIVCQGIGVYALREAVGNTPMKKYLNRVWFNSPELDSTVGNRASLMEDLRTHPEDYSIQLISPLGFNSEVFSGTADGDYVDMVSQANLLKPHGQAFPFDTAANIGSGNGHVNFNSWRNTATAKASPYIYNIVRAGTPEIKNKHGRSDYLELVLESNIYGYTNSVINGDPDSTAIKNFHEPFYIINIIRKGASIVEENVNTYRDIGHYQALNNLVGIGTGEENQSVNVVSERPEDFMPEYPIAGADSDRSIEVGGNKWLCTNYRAQGVIDGWVTGITTDGSITHNTVVYHGLYRVDLADSQKVTKDVSTKPRVDFTLLQTDLTYATPQRIFNFVTAEKTWFVVYNAGALDEYTLFGVVYVTVYFDGIGYPIRKDLILLVNDYKSHTIVGNAIATQLGYTDHSTALKVDIEYPYKDGGYVNAEQGRALDVNRVDYVEGAYTTEGKEPSFKRVDRIVFPYFFPQAGDEIRIKYDNKIPLSIFLGDVVIADSTFIPIDCQVPKKAGASDTYNDHFAFRTPMPAQYYKRAVYYDLFGATNYYTNYIRQWGITSILESTVNLPLIHKDFYPYRQYVIRPYTWETFDADVTAEGILETNNIHVDYDTDYPDEYLNWERGGIHYPEGYNFDYLKKLTTVGFTQPRTGVHEKLVYDKRLHWGMQRNPILFFKGAVKTFPPFNVYDLKNNEASKISILYSVYSSKGDNLYAVTDKGVSLLMINKNTLSSADGDQTMLIMEGTFISGELRLNNYVGCPGERWRGKAEGKVRTPDNLSIPVLVFPGQDDMVLLQDNTLVEFGTNYRTTLQPLIKGIDSGGVYTTPLASGIHEGNNQLWSRIGSKVHIFGFDVNNWLTHKAIDYTKMTQGNRFVATSEGVNRQTVEEHELATFASTTEQASNIVVAVNPGIGGTYEFMDMFLSASDIPDYVHCSTSPSFTDYANCVIGSVQTYADGYFYIRIPRTTTNKVVKGKIMFVKLGFNQNTKLYTLKYLKTGVKKIAGG